MQGLVTLWKKFSSELQGTSRNKLDVITDGCTAPAFVLTEKRYGRFPKTQIQVTTAHSALLSSTLSNIPT